MKKRWVLCPAVAALFLAGCTAPEQTTHLTVTVAGHSDQVDRKRAGRERCSYFDGWLGSGDRVVLRDSGRKLLGVAELRADDRFRDSPPRHRQASRVCSWEASFEDVPADHPAYILEIADFGEVELSRESISRGDVRLHPRTAMAMLTGENVLFEAS